MTKKAMDDDVDGGIIIIIIMNIANSYNHIFK